MDSDSSSSSYSYLSDSDLREEVKEIIEREEEINDTVHVLSDRINSLEDVLQYMSIFKIPIAKNVYYKNFDLKKQYNTNEDEITLFFNFDESRLRDFLKDYKIYRSRTVYKIGDNIRVRKIHETGFCDVKIIMAKKTTNLLKDDIAKCLEENSDANKILTGVKKENVKLSLELKCDTENFEKLIKFADAERTMIKRYYYINKGLSVFTLEKDGVEKLQVCCEIEDLSMKKDVMMGKMLQSIREFENNK